MSITRIPTTYAAMHVCVLGCPVCGAEALDGCVCTLDTLAVQRSACGGRWDAAFARDDIDACDAIMAEIRILSARIAARVTERMQ